MFEFNFNVGARVKRKHTFEDYWQVVETAGPLHFPLVSPEQLISWWVGTVIDI